jgi:hypothetical protein
LAKVLRTEAKNVILVRIFIAWNIHWLL